MTYNPIPPDEEVTIRLPRQSRLSYLTTAIIALGTVFGLFVGVARITTKIDDLGAIVLSIKDTPQQVMMLSQLVATIDKRVTSLEALVPIRENQRIEVKTAIQGVADRLDAHSAALADLQSQIKDVQDKASTANDRLQNILGALEGHPYRDTRGREIH